MSCGTALEARRNSDERWTFTPSSRNYTFSGMAPLFTVRRGETVLLQIDQTQTVNGSLFSVVGDSVVLQLKKGDAALLDGPTPDTDAEALFYDVTLTDQTGFENWIVGGPFTLLGLNDVSCGGCNEKVEVTLGGQCIQINIEGGNLGIGASVNLAALNQAVQDAETSASSAEIDANSAAASAAEAAAYVASIPGLIENKADDDFANVNPETGRNALEAQRQTFVSSPSIIRGVDNKLTQDFHFFDIVTSESDQEAIRTGTSVTDWSDAMDEALARLLVANQDAPGKAMTLADGQIYLSRAIIKPYGAALIGLGREFTRIINTSATGHGIVVPEFDRGSIIRGISIERNVASASGTYGIYLSHGTSGMLIDRVGVRRFQNGIFGGSTDYGTIIQPEIDDCYNDGWVQLDTKSSTDPDIPASYDPAVQWQLEKPLVRWCQGVAYKATANPSGRGHIAGEWRNPGTFENGQTLLIAGSGPSLGVNDVRVNDGFLGSDNFGGDVESYGKNNEFRVTLERMGMDNYGPRFNPDGTTRTRSSPGGTGYGRGFRLGTNNQKTKLTAIIDDTAGYGAIIACDVELDVSVRNPGIAADSPVGVRQFAGQLTGKVASDSATYSVEFGTDESHNLMVSGDPVAGVATPTSSVLSPGGFRDALKVAGVSLIDGQSTGFVAMTGTARKTTFPAYGGGTASATYDQAQFQGVMDALVAATERLKAYDDAFIAKKIPSA